MRTYAPALRAAAVEYPAVRYAALVRGLISAEEILADDPADLTVLFRVYPTFFGVVGPPYLLRLAWGVVRGVGGYEGRDPAPDVRSFGSFALRRPGLPLVPDPASYGGWLDGLSSGAAPASLPDGLSYLGACLAFAIGTEASDDVALHAGDPCGLGPLADLYPYLARRFRIDPGAELPALAVPSPYGEVFTAWANRRLNLTSTSPA